MLWASKVVGVPNLKILGLPTWESLDKMTLAPWPNTKNTIRWLPPSSSHGESCESMFVHVSSMHQKCSNYALTNLLFGLYKSMWIIDLLVIHPNPHPKALARPSTFKVLQAKEQTPTLYPFVVFTFGFVIEFIKKLGGASWMHIDVMIYNIKSICNQNIFISNM